MTALRQRPRLLGDQDLRALLDLLDTDRVLYCVVDARLSAVASLDPSRLGALAWGVDDPGGGGLRAALMHGGNLIPVGSDLDALTSIARNVARTPRGCSSIVGSAQAVEAIWPILRDSWGPARLVRRRQPLLLADRVDGRLCDPAVRRVRAGDLEAFLPAAVSMFTEELGVSPVLSDGGAGYRARVSDLIGSGRAFARFGPDGTVEFKAEIGAQSKITAQLQGIWVDPSLRARGIGRAATAAVMAHALRVVPTVNLYVNEYNRAARRMYHSLGMREVGALSTVLF
jgi:predicted GNAT family acetyltransferase